MFVGDSAFVAVYRRGLTRLGVGFTSYRAGAFVVAVSGDWEGLPTRAELIAFGAGGDPVTR